MLHHPMFVLDFASIGSCNWLILKLYAHMISRAQTFVILLSLLKSKNSCAGPTCPHFTPRLRLEVFGHLEKEDKKLALINVPTYLKPCDCWDWVSLDLKEAEHIFAFSWRELVWRFDELRLLSWRFQGCRILLPILKIRCEKPIFEDGKKNWTK